MFIYKNNDGRAGSGWSCWAAIVKALGPAESQALPELLDPRWTPETATGERVVELDDGTHDIIQSSMVETTDGRMIGTIQELSD